MVQGQHGSRFPEKTAENAAPEACRTQNAGDWASAVLSWSATLSPCMRDGRHDTIGRDSRSRASSMHAVTRFAPSPTGRLHLGHAYSALLAHDFARERGGAFLLRIEDIDPGRSRPEHVDGILEDLLWLGLEWDGEMLYQSRAAAALRRGARAAEGGGPRLSLLLHPRRHRRRDRRRAAPHGAGRPALSRAPAAAWPAPDLSAGRTPGGSTWPRRRRAPGRSTGRTTTPRCRPSPSAFGDVVLARKDAPASYHLAVTVDDAAQGVTDVVRGRDLFASTHVHRLLQALLGLPTPVYHHHALADRRRRQAPRQAPRRADARRSARRRRRPGRAGRGAARAAIARWIFAGAKA